MCSGSPHTHTPLAALAWVRSGPHCATSQRGVGGPPPAPAPLTSQAGAEGQRVHERRRGQADFGVPTQVQEHRDLQRERTVTSHPGELPPGNGPVKFQSAFPAVTQRRVQDARQEAK